MLYDLDIYANSDVLYDLIIYANSDDVLYDLVIYANSDDVLYDLVICTASTTSRTPSKICRNYRPYWDHRGRWNNSVGWSLENSFHSVKQ